MDIIRIKKYRWHGPVIDRKVNSLRKAAVKGIVKTEPEFLEYFVNEVPLSEQLNKFYNSEKGILHNWIGALGFPDQVNIVKVKQLLGKTVTDKDIRNLYPAPDWTDDEFEWYLEKQREELEVPEILVYCCAACGDYDCGGIAVTIDRKEASIIWKFNQNGNTLSFEFDKHSYYNVFKKYLQKISD